MAPMIRPTSGQASGPGLDQYPGGGTSQFGEPTPIDYSGEGFEGLQMVPLCLFFVVLRMTGLVTELAPCLSGLVSTELCVS